MSDYDAKRAVRHLREEYERGFLTAVSLLVRLHDQPTIARDLLVQAGLEAADCSSLNEVDLDHLRVVSRETGIRLRGLRDE